MRPERKAPTRSNDAGLGGLGCYVSREKMPAIGLRDPIAPEKGVRQIPPGKEPPQHVIPP